jgi:hypothetical protein
MNLDKAFDKLRSRNRPVPQPPRLPTASEVDAAEQRLGIHFHPDYRRYLLDVSDVVCGTKEPVTITIPDSHTDLIEVAESAWDSYGVPRNLVPLCEDNADFYCMNSAGEIVFWSHNGLSSERWQNLGKWIQDVWLAGDQES